MKKNLKLLFLLLFFGFSAFKPGPELAELPQTDESMLIELILRRGLLDDNNKVPDHRLFRDNRKIVLSRSVVNKFIADSKEEIIFTDYGPERFPKRVGKAKILALTPEEIQKLADEEGDFLYLELGNIKVEGNRAEIGLATTWAVSKNTKNKVYTSGGGYLLAYEKVDGKWQFKNVIRSWIA